MLICFTNNNTTARKRAYDIRRQSKYHYTNKYKMSITKKRSKKKNYGGLRRCIMAYQLTSWPAYQLSALLWTPEIFLASTLTRKTSGPERQHPLWIVLFFSYFDTFSTILNRILHLPVYRAFFVKNSTFLHLFMDIFMLINM